MSIPKYIDLHIHSIFSNDGSLTPEEILSKAVSLKFKTIAIADHDTIAGIPQIISLSKIYPIEVIPALEISTEFNSHLFHILAYFVDINNDYILQLIKELKEIRKEKNYHRIKSLISLGLIIPPVLIDSLEKGELILGPKLASLIIQENLNKEHPLIKYYENINKSEAPILFYKEIIKKIDKEYRGVNWLYSVKAIEMVKKSKAIAILAHPGAPLFAAACEDIKFLKEKGLHGIEVYSTYHSPEQVNYFKKLADELNFLVTGGSDFHGAIKPKIEFGSVKLEDYSIVEKLKEAQFAMR